ncbi:hypothetical protein ACH47Z_38285 [Streptomyces sp. NPDC020192]|uniref:hypothetical protein n=1 Tax=Streptomyces sp. NPDC020192 TaxID=3365066 RepID=UPI0037B4B051
MDTQQPDTKTVTALFAEAVAAPSMHNAQPWRFRFKASEGVLLLLADLERAMPHSDPDNRALRIGCGAALFNLRVAAAHAGFAPLVQLLPDPAEPRLLAAVQLREAGRPASDEEDLSRLHPAIRERHTSRHPFEEKHIPADVQAALQRAANRGSRAAVPRRLAHGNRAGTGPRCREP